MSLSLRINLIILLSIATQHVSSSTTWHGFVAQGVHQSRGSDFIADDDDISLALTEVGVNTRITLGSGVDAVAQVVYLDGGNRYNQGLRLDYAFIDWQLLSSPGNKLNLHVGRYKNHDWLESATRDVPHARSTTVLPQSIYFDGLRDIALGSDGVSMQWVKEQSNSAWNLTWSYGQSELDEDTTRRLLGPSVMGETSQDYAHHFSLYYQPTWSNWQIGFSALDTEFSYEPSHSEPLLPGYAVMRRWVFSGRYSAQNWELQGELIGEKVEFGGVFSPQFLINRIGEGGYVQWRYIPDAQWDVILRYDTYDLNRDDRSGQQLEQESGGLIPAYYGYMDMGTLSVGYQFAPQWRVRGEFSRVHGAGRINPISFPEALIDAKPYWSMWSLQVMYWF